MTSGSLLKYIMRRIFVDVHTAVLYIQRLTYSFSYSNKFDYAFFLYVISYVFHLIMMSFSKFGANVLILGL